MNNLAIGIVYKEKAQLDLLAAQVAEAQFVVNQQQANASALQAKSVIFNDFLTSADANKQSALANYNLAKDIDSSTRILCGSTELVMNQADKACQQISKVSKDMAQLIEKLIFLVELINKFGQLVNKQKASNPLIPDTLVSVMAKAISDANNAIALSLTALESCYASEATTQRSKKVIHVQYEQVELLKKRIESASKVVSISKDGRGILLLSEDAYESSKQKYEQALVDNSIVNKQLAHAQNMLAKATTSLSSYQAGLAAATAAAYAA